MRPSWARQIRGELRKVVSPVVAIGVAAAAAYAVFAQLRPNAATRCAPAPTPFDWTGATRIAIDQHITVIGFVLTGVFAGFTTGAEAENDSLDHAFLAASSPVRIWSVRILAVLIALAISILVMAISVRVSAHWLVWPPGCTASRYSSVAGLAGDIGTGLGALMFAAVLMTVVALVSKSSVITVVVAAVVLMVPSVVHSGWTIWLFPAEWIVESTHLVDIGHSGVDYVLSLESGYSHRGSAAVLGTGLLWGSAAALSVLGVWLLKLGRRRSRRAWQVLRARHRPDTSRMR